MERPTKKIILPHSKCEVEIITYFTWGEKEKIQDVMMSGASIEDAGAGKIGFDTSAMLRSKYTLLETAILNVKCGEETKGYSKEWMDNLSEDDGDLLVEELEGLSKKKT